MSIKNRKLVVGLMIGIPVVVAATVTGLVLGLTVKQGSSTHVIDPGEDIKTQPIDTNQCIYEISLDKEYKDEEVSVNLIINTNDDNLSSSKQVVGNKLYVTVKANHADYNSDLTYNFSLNVVTTEWNETITGFRFVIPKMTGKVNDRIWKEAINEILKDDQNFTVDGTYTKYTKELEKEIETETYDFVSKYDSNKSQQIIKKTGEADTTYYLDQYKDLYWYVKKQDDESWKGTFPTQEKFGSDEFYSTLIKLEELKDKSTSQMQECYDEASQYYYYKGTYDLELEPYKYSTISYGWWFDNTFKINQSKLELLLVKNDNTIIIKDTDVDYKDYNNSSVTLPFESKDIDRSNLFKANFSINDNCFKVTIPEKGMQYGNSYYCISLDLTDSNIPDTFTINTLYGEYVSESTITKSIDYCDAMVDGAKTQSTIENDIVIFDQGITINKSQLPNEVNFIIYCQDGQNSPFTFYLKTNE